MHQNVPILVTVTEMSDSSQSASSVDKMPPDSFQTRGFREEKTEEGREGKRNPAGPRTTQMILWYVFTKTFKEVTYRSIRKLIY